MDFDTNDITVNALCPNNNRQENGKLVLHKETLKRYVDKRQFHMVAQFDRLVKYSVLHPEFVFSGLERRLFNDDETDGDNNKLIYISNPRSDYVWRGDKFDGEIIKETKPRNCVFTVIVSINKRHKTNYPDAFGFIDEWSWCDSEESGKKPVNWIDRYDKLIYNKISLI